jgi:hypothetical protein
MKKILIILAGAFLLCFATSAMAVNLAWTDPNPVSAGVTEYHIYWFETANPANLGSAVVYGYQNTTGTIDDVNFLWNVQYSFTVTAKNASLDLESAESDALAGYMDQTFTWIAGVPPGGGGGIVLGPPSSLHFSTENGTPASEITKTY